MSTSTSSNGSTPKEAQGGGVWHEIRTKLITKEDPIHLHKTLGILCLLSYIWRFSMIGDSDMGFAKYPNLTVPTLLLHLALSLSSFIFRIPKKRISRGSRIWPEYRLHSCGFACRNIFQLLLYYYEETHGLSPIYIGNFLVVFVNMVFCDLSSWSVGQYHSNSVREFDIPKFVKPFFSYMQFRATTSILYGTRRYSLFYYILFVVQFTPFLATLQRKNLGPHLMVWGVYALMLVVALVNAYNEYLVYGDNTARVVGAIASIIAVIRCGPRIPGLEWNLQHRHAKYLLWAVVYFAILPKFRTNADKSLPEDCPLTEEQLRVLFLVSNAALVALAVWVQKFKPERKVESEEKKAA